MSKQYFPSGKEEIQEMLKEIGVSSVSQLFESIPEELKIKEKLNIPGPLDEISLLNYFEEISKKNNFLNYTSFLGAGAYNHFIPYIVDYLSMRGEFLTPYTPYQPELSQGTLQTIFEYQTLISKITGMEISNASLYDGGSAAAEAALMATRLRKGSKILISRTIHPEWKDVIHTYFKNLSYEILEIPYSREGKININILKKSLDKDSIAFIIQHPNFFGIIEDIKEISKIVKQNGSLFLVGIAEPISLGILRPPGESDVDIVFGEAQSFGIPLSFGGPYLGFLSTKMEYLRQMPGRLAGETVDRNGKRGFVLTLTTREQHIKREKATSNICTNEAWCALRATIYLETMGKQGLREVSYQNLQKALYAKERISELKNVKLKFNSSNFNEFVVEYNKDPEEVNDKLKERNILGGFILKKDYPELEKCALLCVTETHKKEDIDYFIDCLKKIL
ncbi:MAG: aminomethyl-transferring glycine dehydrogenase subunit GcvPA [Acidobacteriota bacterium]